MLRSDAKQEAKGVEFHTVQSIWIVWKKTAILQLTITEVTHGMLNCLTVFKLSSNFAANLARSLLYNRAGSTKSWVHVFLVDQRSLCWVKVFILVYPRIDRTLSLIIQHLDQVLPKIITWDTSQLSILFHTSSSILIITQYIFKLLKLTVLLSSPLRLPTLIKSL